MPNLKINPQKIKCFVLSDLHLEMLVSKQVDDFFRELALRIQRHIPEVLILAGDITSLANQNRCRSHFEQFVGLGKPVVYVTGNHEYYKYSIRQGVTRLDELARDPNLKGLHVLTSGTETNINGVKFVGDTLWYPESKDWRLSYGITDHRLISDHRAEVSLCYKSFVWSCVPTISKDCIVVTHHMPFNGSINQKYFGDPYNHFFMTDCSKFVDNKNSPRAWIHGHGHDPSDYVLPTGTRVYSNPLGYVEEGSNPDFWDRMVVEL